MTQINLDTLPRSRKEARELGSTYYLRDACCPKGHTPAVYLTGGGECKLCVNQRNTAAQKAKPAAARARRQRWKDKNPGAQLNAQRAFHARNPGKATEYTRVWNQLNPDRKRAHSVAGEHKRRSRVQGNGVFLVSKTELDRIRRQPCLNCGAVDGITIEHLIPISRGGRHSLGNLAALCGSCNSSKRNKTWMEFRLFQRQKKGPGLRPDPLLAFRRTLGGLDCHGGLGPENS